MNVSELRLRLYKYVQQKLYCYFIKVITQFASSLIHTKGKLYTYIFHFISIIVIITIINLGFDLNIMPFIF